MIWGAKMHATIVGEAGQVSAILRESMLVGAMVAKEGRVAADDETIARLVATRHQQLQRLATVTVLASGVSRKVTDQVVRHKGLTCIASSSMYTQRTLGTPPIVTDDELQAELDEFYEIGAELYAKLVAEVDEDDASYMLPLSSPGSIIISATPWEFKHFIRTRKCKLNTDETIQFAELIGRVLKDVDPVIFSDAEMDVYCSWQVRGLGKFCPETPQGRPKCVRGGE